MGQWGPTCQLLSVTTNPQEPLDGVSRASAGGGGGVKSQGQARGKYLGSLDVDHGMDMQCMGVEAGAA